MPAIIVLGDKTDHGGEVIEASGFTDTHGKKMARVGDKVYCPKKGHGITEIVTGDLSFVIDGKAAAYHGCKTSCGATVLSSQAVTTLNFGGGSSANSARASNAIAVADSMTNEQALIFDEQSHLVSTEAVVEGLAWFIEVKGGRTMSGAIGADGLLPRFDTLTEGEYNLYVGDEALSKIQAS